MPDPSMMSRLPNAQTAFCATARAMGAAMDLSCSGVAASISSRVPTRLSGVRPPNQSPSWRRASMRAFKGESKPATVATT